MKEEMQALHNYAKPYVPVRTLQNGSRVRFNAIKNETEGWEIRYGFGMQAGGFYVERFQQGKLVNQLHYNKNGMLKLTTRLEGTSPEAQAAALSECKPFDTIWNHLSSITGEAQATQRHLPPVQPPVGASSRSTSSISVPLPQSSRAPLSLKQSDPGYLKALARQMYCYICEIDRAAYASGTSQRISLGEGRGSFYSDLGDIFVQSPSDPDQWINLDVIVEGDSDFRALQTSGTFSRIEAIVSPKSASVGVVASPRLSASSSSSSSSSAFFGSSSNSSSSSSSWDPQPAVTNPYPELAALYSRISSLKKGSFNESIKITEQGYNRILYGRTDGGDIFIQHTTTRVAIYLKQSWGERIVPTDDTSGEIAEAHYRTLEDNGVFEILTKHLSPPSSSSSEPRQAAQIEHLPALGSSSSSSSTSISPTRDPVGGGIVPVAGESKQASDPYPELAGLHRRISRLITRQRDTEFPIMALLKQTGEVTKALNIVKDKDGVSGIIYYGRDRNNEIFIEYRSPKGAVSILLTEQGKMIVPTDAVSMNGQGAGQVALGKYNRLKRLDVFKKLMQHLPVGRVEYVTLWNGKYKTAVQIYSDFGLGFSNNNQGTAETHKKMHERAVKRPDGISAAALGYNL